MYTYIRDIKQEVMNITYVSIYTNTHARIIDNSPSFNISDKLRSRKNFLWSVTLTYSLEKSSNHYNCWSNPLHKTKTIYLHLIQIYTYTLMKFHLERESRSIFYDFYL